MNKIMSFQTPDWDNDVVGDSTCAELFQGNFNKRKKRKKKQKREIIDGHIEKSSNEKLTKHIQQKIKHNEKNRKKINTENNQPQINSKNDKSTASVFTVRDFDVSGQNVSNKTIKKKKKHKKNMHNSDEHKNEDNANKNKSPINSNSMNSDTSFKNEDSIKVKKKKKKHKNLIGKEHSNENVHQSKFITNIGPDVSYVSQEEKSFESKKKKNNRKHKKEVDSKNFNDNRDSAAIKNNESGTTLDIKLETSKKKKTKTNLSLDSEKQFIKSSSKLPKEPYRNIKNVLLQKIEKNEITQNKKFSINENKKNLNSVSRNQKKKEKLKMKLKDMLSTQDDPAVAGGNKKKFSLRERMLEKLKSARFRYLNEQMYLTEGKEAENVFKSDPESYKAYHEGYRQQVKKWPLNPLSVVIKSIQKMPKSHIVADLGCGDALLSRSVSQAVHSFDLVAVNESVTACDMAHVPLKNESVDIVVFCLSLMGTNLHDYLLEANRILKVGGVMKIAEVESRFDNIENFIEGVHHFGFKNTVKDLSHNLFYFLDFKKITNKKNKKKLPTISLNPCMYKKR